MIFILRNFKVSFTLIIWKFFYEEHGGLLHKKLHLRNCLVFCGVREKGIIATNSFFDGVQYLIAARFCD